MEERPDLPEGIEHLQIPYYYSSVPTICRFALSNKRIRCLSGPIGSGKTSGCIIEIVRRGFLQSPDKNGVRRTRWIVVNSDYRQMRDTTIRTFHDWFPPKIFGKWDASKSIYYITNMPNIHIEVWFRSCEGYSLKGLLPTIETTGAWINNVEQVEKETIFDLDSLIGRYPSQRDGGPSWYGMIMDSYFGREKDSYLNLVEDSDNCEIFYQPSGLADNAENLVNLPLDFYQLLSRNKTDEFLKNYITG